MTNFGIDCLLRDNDLRAELAGRRIGLVGHSASLTAGLVHSLDALCACEELAVVAAFGPQHGMKGDKQDNMVESEDYVDPLHGIPVISLYGKTRRPTNAMMDGVDVILFDLQALGCRVYTYITTLRYFLEICAKRGVPIWVLDRPNPTGRMVDGLTLRPGQQSFVGCDELPMAYGMTNGELAAWMCTANGYDADLRIVPVEPYDPDAPPGFGWPLPDRPWVNPSPNAASLNMARCFPGTVLIEGTTLSEGRGTTVPLEVIGAPDLDARRLLATMEALAPEWLAGARLRHCYFEPGFHKHAGRLCEGIQIHADGTHYRPAEFRPYRLVALMLKALRSLAPDFDLWRTHEYEYEPGRLPIDVINGGPELRDWVDDPSATVADLAPILEHERESWLEASRPHFLY